MILRGRKAGGRVFLQQKINIPRNGPPVFKVGFQSRMLLRDKVSCSKVKSYLITKEALRHVKILPCFLFPYLNCLPVCIGGKKMGRNLELDGSSRSADLRKTPLHVTWSKLPTLSGLQFTSVSWGE